MRKVLNRGIAGIGVVAMVVLALVAGTADAGKRDGKRIVVLDIEGARDSDLREAVAKLLGERHEIVAADEFEEAAREMDARKRNARNIKIIAAMIEADAVLEGTLVMESEEWYMLRFRLREGVTGRTVKRIALRLRQPRLPQRLGSELGDKLLVAMDQVPKNPALGDDEPKAKRTASVDKRTRKSSRSERAERRRKKASDAREEAEERQVRAERAEPKATSSSRKKARAAAMEDEDDEDLELDDLEDEDDFDDELDDDDGERRTRTAALDDDEDEMPAQLRASRDDAAPAGGWTPADRARRGAMNLSAGLSVVSRELQFAYRADFPQAPQNYQGPMAPGVYAAGELYPLAIDASRRDLASRFGVGFMADMALGLQTQLADEMQTILPTEQLRYGVGVRYRHPIGDKPTSPTVKVSAGYGRMSFVIDKTGLPEGYELDLPNTSYTYFDPGLELRVPVSQKLALTAGGRALLITDAGEVQQLDQYGTAVLTGFDAGGALEYLATDRLLVTVAGRYAAVGYEFAGDGEQASARDGDPDTIDVGGALDRYVGGRVTVGYLF